jgi:hypothetical protein
MNGPSEDVVTDHVEWVIAARSEEEAIVWANDHNVRRASDWVWVQSTSREVRAFRLTPEDEVAPFRSVGPGETYVPRRLPAQMVASEDHYRRRFHGGEPTEDERRNAVEVLTRASALSDAARVELDRYISGELTGAELEDVALARIRSGFAEQRSIAAALANKNAAHGRLLARLPLTGGPIPTAVSYAWIRHFTELARAAGHNVHEIEDARVQIDDFVAQLDEHSLPPYRPDLEDRDAAIRRLVDDGPSWPEERDDAIRLLIEGGAI